MVCVFVFVCLWGSTFAGLAFCATLSMTKLIIIIIQGMIILHKSSQLTQYTHLVYIIVSCTTSKAGEARARSGGPDYVQL